MRGDPKVFSNNEKRYCHRHCPPLTGKGGWGRDQTVSTPKNNGNTSQTLSQHLQNVFIMIGHLRGQFSHFMRKLNRNPLKTRLEFGSKELTSPPGKLTTEGGDVFLTKNHVFSGKSIPQ